MAFTRRVQKIFDANLELRDIADGAETSSADETAIALAVRDIEQYKAIFYVSAMDTGDANETYVFDISVSDTSGGTYTKVAVTPDIAALGTGVYEVPLSGALVEGLDADAAYIRCGVTIAGTTPSITYGSFLTNA